MSINTLSSASVENSAQQAVAFNRGSENRPVEAGSSKVNLSSRPQANESARAVEVTDKARLKASENAQVLRFEADKNSTVQSSDGNTQADGTQERKNAPEQAQLQQALETTNQLSTIQVRQLEFTASEEDGRTVIKVIDKKNDEVIRQIPSEDFIKMAQQVSDLTQQLHSAQGLLFESKV